MACFRISSWKVLNKKTNCVLILIVADVPRLNKSHYILLPYLALNQQAGSLYFLYSVISRNIEALVFLVEYLSNSL